MPGERGEPEGAPGARRRLEGPAQELAVHVAEGPADDEAEAGRAARPELGRDLHARDTVAGPVDDAAVDRGAARQVEVEDARLPLGEARHIAEAEEPAAGLGQDEVAPVLRAPHFVGALAVGQPRDGRAADPLQLRAGRLQDPVDVGDPRSLRGERRQPVDRILHAGHREEVDAGAGDPRALAGDAAAEEGRAEVLLGRGLLPFLFGIRGFDSGARAARDPRAGSARPLRRRPRRALRPGPPPGGDRKQKKRTIPAAMRKTAMATGIFHRPTRCSLLMVHAS